MNSLSIFTAIFHVDLVLAHTRMSPFWILQELRMTEVMVTTGAITCKAPVKLSSPTNQHATFYRPDALLVAQPTVSEHWREVSGKWTDLINVRRAVDIVDDLFINVRLIDSPVVDVVPINTFEHSLRTSPLDYNGTSYIVHDRNFDWFTWSYTQTHTDTISAYI